MSALLRLSVVNALEAFPMDPIASAYMTPSLFPEWNIYIVRHICATSTHRMSYPSWIRRFLSGCLLTTDSLALSQHSWATCVKKVLRNSSSWSISYGSLRQMRVNGDRTSSQMVLPNLISLLASYSVHVYVASLILTGYRFRNKFETEKNTIFSLPVPITKYIFFSHPTNLT